jgi:hypothetical protein
MVDLCAIEGLYAPIDLENRTSSQAQQNGAANRRMTAHALQPRHVRGGDEI